MPELKWKTTQLQTPEGAVKVTHWAKHDPTHLIEAINNGTLVESDHPKVFRSHLGRYKIAIRNFEYKRSRFSEHPLDLFAALRDLADRRVAIVEMPVAMVEKGNEATLVTLWKDESTPFHHFIRDDKISFEKKRLACLKMVREVAKLHANGYTHGHLKLDNFLVDKNYNPKLIDFTKMRRVDPELACAELGIYSQGGDFFHYLSDRLHNFAEFVAPEDNAIAYQAFKQLLESEYQKYYDLHIAKNADK